MDTLCIHLYEFIEQSLSVIPACPESLLKKDSRRALLAGMTQREIYKQTNCLIVLITLYAGPDTFQAFCL